MTQKQNERRKRAVKPLRIIPLGGLGEVGKNMMAYEYGNNILVVDAGLMFPENDMLGIDYIIPDYQYLIDHRNKIRGIVITHGHEDHIGAIKHLLEQVSAPVYATPLTRGLIEVKLRRHGLIDNVTLHTVQANDVVKIGPFKVEFVHVSHSIPDAVALGITTPAGFVVHSGDYKFDHTPVDNWPTDFARLAQFAERGVDVLLADSTNAERPGWTPSERVIDSALDTVFQQAPGRIIVASFASLISRMQQVADTAVRYGRKMAFAGTSMVDNAKMAQELGYLKIPKKTLVSLQEALHMPAKDVVLMCTGSQGEPTSIIGRLSTGTNRAFDLLPDDTIVLSAHAIPGNEEIVSRTINRLLRRGVEVIYDAILPVHVSGHASQEEQKLLINLLRPRNFVPIHGELRQLKRHAAIAREMGIPEENILVVENGQIIELVAGKLRLGERVPGGYVFVEGNSIGEIDFRTMREREQLARSGIVLIDLTVDKFSGRLIHPPEIITRGFIASDDEKKLLAALEKKVTGIVEGGGMDNERVIMNAVRTFLYKRTQRRPMVFVTLSKA